MSLATHSPSLADHRSRIALEAEVDLGVTGRLLDLLVAYDRLPQTMNLRREGRTMTVTMEMPSGVEAGAGLLALMRGIPGVRTAGSIADAS
ncbi:hypothetical protein [Rhizorhabdus phycosphaerae]|uniref:hypothetical protein n=1 Tax=Rhizorhabdus phycosphaerae TaxID=2711156 RepID=UPI0013EA42C3|nr:hypothetical protein [Rhizorhabdus phycosphaerae]